MRQPLGNLFIVAAPSGAGKSSLINALLADSQKGAQQSPDNVAGVAPTQVSVSHTTRAPRPGEVDGVHYHFVDVASFESMVQEQAFYEYAKVFGNYYGTSKAAISDKLMQGIDVFLDIDWQGARQIKALQPEVVSIFILPPSKNALQERLVKRGQDTDDVIAARMASAINEMQHFNEFDHVVVNDDFEQAKADIAAIVRATQSLTLNQQLRHAALFAELLEKPSNT